MIEECGRIVAVDSDAVWVETTARSGCGRCQEAGGCGQNSIFRMLGDRTRQLRVYSGTVQARVGDTAVVGVPGGALVRASLLAYLVPLLALLAGAVIGHNAAGGADFGAILGGIAGLVAGFAGAHLVTVRLAPHLGLNPVLLSVGRSDLAAPAGASEASA